MSDEFKEKIRSGYAADSRWFAIINQSTPDERNENSANLPYTVQNGFLYSTQEDGDQWLCIPRALAPDIFRLIHDDPGHQGYDRCRQKMDGLVISSRQGL